MKTSNNILISYLKTALKASPWMIISMVLLVIVAKVYIKYSTPYFESTSKIKIDQGTVGLAKSNLFKDFDVFTSTNEIMTEIEVLKSTRLIKKTLEKLDFSVQYYRIGDIKTTELYKESPFIVKTVESSDELIEKDILIEILKDGYKIDERKYNFGDTVSINSSIILVELNHKLISNKKIDQVGRYIFKVRDKNKLASRIKKGMDITAIDKDVSVVRISYKDVVPEKTTDFVNAHAEAYIQDFIDNRSQAANKSLNFLDNQLNDVLQKLRTSENRLENFKLSNGIINTSQETETGLKKISQLNIQLASIKMKQAALDSLNSYINSSNKNFLDLAPQFEVFGDMLYIELIKKIQEYRAKRKELLINYTVHSEEVKTLDSKLSDLVAYIKESVKNSKYNAKTQRIQIENEIQLANEEFKNTPTIEKNMTSLKREFDQTQKLYNYLAEKRSEAALASSAGYSFHQVLEEASVPKSPISPNKTLITFLAGFLGALLGIGLYYLKSLLFSNRIKSIEEMEKLFSGDNYLINNNFKNLVSKLIIKEKLKKKDVLNISSNSKKSNEYLEALGETFARLGWKVLIVNFNFHTNWRLNSKTKTLNEIILENDLFSNNEIEISENLYAVSTSYSNDDSILFNHDNLKGIITSEKTYDLIITLSPSVLNKIDSLAIAKIVNHNISLLDSKSSNINHLNNYELIAKEYNLSNLSLGLIK